MAERIYENPENNREYIEVGSNLHNDIVNYAMENDLTLGVAAGEYIEDLMTPGDGENGEESDE